MCARQSNCYSAAVLLCLALLMLWSIQATAQQQPYEATSKDVFRDQDTLPGSLEQQRQGREFQGGLWDLGPGRGPVKRISFAADAHAETADYDPGKRCVSCHEEQRYSLHSTRAEITCVQCHKDEPVAGIFHYYSPMNPLRRHVYVCAKCHEGATASFATYVIHEPRPLAASTAESFPLFYYAVWFMVILAGGVFVIFIPYVTLWGIRELIALLARGKHHE